MDDARPTHDEVAHAVLYAKSAELVARFYGAVVGLERTGQEHGFVTVRSRELELVVIEIPQEIAASIAISKPPTRREDTPIKLSFTVPSIDAARGIAPTFGGIVDASSREWAFRGVRICDGHDPEGNVFQLRTRSAPEG